MGKRLAIAVIIVFAVCFFVASFLILYHQKVTFGTYFELDQVLHHEVVALFFFALGIGIMFGAAVFAIIDRL